MKKTYFYPIKENYQLTYNDCGLSCLYILYRYFYNNHQSYFIWLQNYYCSKNLSLKDLKEIGSKHGLVCNFYYIDIEELETIKIISPIIIIIKNNFDHAIILYGRRNEKFYCFCPQKGRICYSLFELNYLFSGYIGIVNKSDNLSCKLTFNSNIKKTFPVILYGILIFLTQFNWVLLFLIIKAIYGYPEMVSKLLIFLIIFIIYWILFNIFLFFILNKLNNKYRISDEIGYSYSQLINTIGSFLVLLMLCLSIQIDNNFIEFLFISIGVNFIISIFKIFKLADKIANIFLSFLISSIIFYLFFNPQINGLNITWWWVINMLIFNFSKIIHVKKIILCYNKIFFWVLNHKM
ncbi:MAG: cysteine peptidase family C39 domain-containing protein [Mycoplasma sp.]